MADKKRLAYSIIQFLQDQLQNGGLSPDAQESLEGMQLLCVSVRAHMHTLCTGNNLGWFCKSSGFFK